MFVYASMPAIIMSYLQSEFLIEIQWTFYLFWLTICIVFCHVDTPDYIYLLTCFLKMKNTNCENSGLLTNLSKIFANIVGNADHLLEYWILYS